MLSGGMLHIIPSENLGLRKLCRRERCRWSRGVCLWRMRTVSPCSEPDMAGPCCNGRLDIKLVEASLDSRDMSVWFVSHAIGKLANRKLCPRKAKPKHQLSLVL